MKIKRTFNEHRYDFHADMECEHCGHIQTITTGYNDAYYHQKVIPAMTCRKCGKNRSGDIPEQANPAGILPV